MVGKQTLKVMNKMLFELYVSFGVATILFILFNKKFNRSPPCSPDPVLETEPMDIPLLDISTPFVPEPMDISPPLSPILETQPMSVSEDETSSENFEFKEKWY